MHRSHNKYWDFIWFLGSLQAFWYQTFWFPSPKSSKKKLHRICTAILGKRIIIKCIIQQEKYSCRRIHNGGPTPKPSNNFIPRLNRKTASFFFFVCNKPLQRLKGYKPKLGNLTPDICQTWHRIVLALTNNNKKPYMASNAKFMSTVTYTTPACNPSISGFRPLISTIPRVEPVGFRWLGKLH